MRIAQVAPLNESVPPQLYGGTERVISYLTEELVRMGHEVTLFATGDSKTSARLVPVWPRALWRESHCPETLAHHVRLMEIVFRHVSRFDIVHFHCDHVQFPFIRRQPCPSLTTCHGRLDGADVAALFEEYAEVALASISDDQRRPVPAANWQATVYHGLPRDLYPFRKQSRDYLLFLGRLCAEKGITRAVEIARRAKRKLVVAAKIDLADRTYYEQTVVPLFKENCSCVEFLGEVGGRDKDQLLGNASALLFPIDWPEPFGLVMIEALACGTPVIGWRTGSVPEVLEDGVTGFIVDNVEDAVSAAERVAQLDRQVCRRAFEERFDAARMAQDYLRVYQRLQARDSDGDAPVARRPASRNRQAFDQGALNG